MCLFSHTPLVLGRFHHVRMRLHMSSAGCHSQSSIAHSFASSVLQQGMQFTIGLPEFMLSTFFEFGLQSLPLFI